MAGHKTQAKSTRLEHGASDGIAKKEKSLPTKVAELEECRPEATGDCLTPIEEGRSKNGISSEESRSKRWKDT